MFVFFLFARDTFWGNGVQGSARISLPTDFWFIVYTLAYGIPLYYVYFLKNNTYKTYLLHITENDFQWKTIFKQFTLNMGKYDIFVFAVYSALLLLPFKDVFDNPAAFLCVPQSYFYLLPVPRIISYILSVVFFTAQYYTCLGFAIKHWDKNRLHSNRIP